MIRIWLTALALAAVAIVALLAVPRSWGFYGHEAPSTPDVFVGTSLLAFGMPSTGSGLLGNGRPYARIAVGIMPEDTLIHFFDLLVSQDSTEVIVLEIFPLMRDFAFEYSGAFQPTFLQEVFAALNSLSSDLKTRFKAVITILTGLQSSMIITEVENTIGAQRVTSHDLQFRYPLRLRRPLYPKKFREILDHAHNRGIDVYLIAPPLPQVVADYIGADRTALLEQHIHDTAVSIGVPLLYNGEFWPNDLFLDVGHLNSDGRARFMKEVTDAWKTRHDN